MKSSGKKRNLTWYKKKLDSAYSRWIRLKDAEDKMVRCFTCGKTLHWKDSQCGHYVHRRHNSLRYDERNTKPQCVGCNMFGGGKLDDFAYHLTQVYGTDIIETLHKVKQEHRKFTIGELKVMIEVYKAKVKDLEL